MIGLAIVGVLAALVLGAHGTSGVEGREITVPATRLGAGVSALESAPPQPVKPTPASTVASSGGASATAPGYDELVADQTRTPKSRFTPCNLVTRSQAEAIIGGRIRPPIEAPQGPTCIYRSTSGDRFTTLEVQRLDFDTVRRRLRGRQRVVVSGRTAYCGTIGRPMLYVPVSGGRVLSVSGPCGIARRFAAKAAPRLRS